MLSAKQLSVLTDQEKSEYGLLEAGFNTEFWTRIKDIALAGADDAFARAARAGSWEDNRRSIGEYSVWTLLANFEETIEQQYSTVADSRMLEQLARNEQTYE